MNRALFAAVILGVSVLIGLGLNAVGGPGYARSEQQDRQRLQDLVELVYFLSCDDEDVALSASLPEDGFCDDRTLPKQLNDRVTGQPYVYRKISDDTFEVCAKFTTQAAFDPSGRGIYLGTRGRLKVQGQDGCLRRKRTDSGWVAS